jgi:hypothetical protein
MKLTEPREGHCWCKGEEAKAHMRNADIQRKLREGKWGWVGIGRVLSRALGAHVEAAATYGMLSLGQVTLKPKWNKVYFCSKFRLMLRDR